MAIYNQSVSHDLKTSQKPHENLAPRVFVSMFAGDASYIGEYYQMGTLNGQPYYKLDDAELYVFYWIDAGEFWTINSTLVYYGLWKKYGSAVDGTYDKLWSGDHIFVTLTEPVPLEAGRSYIGAGSGSGSADGVYLYSNRDAFGVPYYYNSAKGLYLYFMSEYGSTKWIIGTAMDGTSSNSLYYAYSDTGYPKLNGYTATYGVAPGPTFTEVVPIEESVSNDVEFDTENDYSTSKGSGNVSGFGQVVDNYTEHVVSSTHGAGFGQIAAGRVGEIADNYLGLDDAASAFVQKNLSRMSRFHQTVTKYKIHTEAMPRNLGIHQTVSAVNSRGARNRIGLHGEAHRAYHNTPDDLLGFDQDLFKIEYADPTSGFGQSVTVELVRAGHNNLSIAQSASPAQSIYGRVGISSPRFRSVVRLFIRRSGGGGGGEIISTDGVNYNPRVANADDPIPGVCPPSNCIADHITLDYVGDVSMNMDLRNPYEDTQGLNLNLINAYTRGQELQHDKNGFPTFETLDYKFKMLNLAKREEFFTFYKLSAGMEITLTDYCGNDWLGVILDPVITSELYAGGGQCGNGFFYNLSFKFEGVMI